MQQQEARFIKAYKCDILYLTQLSCVFLQAKMKRLTNNFSLVFYNVKKIPKSDALCRLFSYFYRVRHLLEYEIIVVEEGRKIPHRKNGYGRGDPFPPCRFRLFVGCGGAGGRLFVRKGRTDRTLRPIRRR